MNFASMVVAFLTSGAFKRAAAAIGTSVAAMAVPFVNSKLHLELSDTVVATVISALVVNAGTYMVQSMSNEKHARDAGVAAAAQVNNVDDAMKIIKGVGVVQPSAPTAPVVDSSGLPGGLPTPRSP